MTRLLVLICIIGVLFGCNLSPEVSAIKHKNKEQKVWVYAQLNVAAEKKMVTYYYYAEISKTMYQRIADNTVNKGFIHFDKVKYWGNSDLISEYKDGESSGELIFRIEDIKKLDLINMEPKAGLGYEQFDVDHLLEKPLAELKAVTQATK